MRVDPEQLPPSHTSPATTLTPSVPGAPEVRLLMAWEEGPDEALALDAAARGLAEEVRREGAAFVSLASHFPFALVAWHSHPVGVEIEPHQPAGPGEPDAFATSLWCSKEALARALGDPVAYEPGRLGSPVYWRDGAAGPWRAAQLEVPAGHNGWLCWRAA